MKLKNLFALAIAIGFMSCVYADEAKTHYLDIPGVQANTLIKTSKAWNGQTLPAYGEGQPEITIVRYKIAPGATLPMHMHPVINAGVLIKGQLTVKTKEGGLLTMKAGEPIVELFREWHYGTNPGNEDVDLIIVYAGIIGTPLVIREQ
ncbi:MAG: cupin domain-containing protein [Fluviibacter sp.]